MNGLGLTAVAGITAICYLVGLVVKASPWNNNQYIPIACGLVGGILGMVGMYIIPDYPATDLITAAAVGVVSGLAATGLDQAAKQMTKGDEG